MAVSAGPGYGFETKRDAVVTAVVKEQGQTKVRVEYAAVLVLDEHDFVEAIK